ncbi:transcriptional regulator, AlpA family [Pseudovibrio denitrificans]|uniref:Transcriptional regulator, AlpA family n=2 Tax=Pseudovibrio denitrificans TaxID=258256 RepID=A0A1I7DP05_9HYPH|nr:hypothetical protein [Pseudovibrio denitrificans]SFU13419.1 transcriptional regulator, AlpA family [Pseudovibrio denitrificans]
MARMNDSDKVGTILLTLTELSEMMKLSFSRLWKLRKDCDKNGFPKPIRIHDGARGLRWRLDEVEIWMESRRTTSGI